MANEHRNTTSSRPPTIEALLLSAEDAWRSNGAPRWELVCYELSGRKIREDYVSTPQAFNQVRAWMKFIDQPSFTAPFEADERGRNKHQFWNDLELAICRYNIASVLQGLLWFSGTDRHSMIPDHRRLSREQQPKQPPPFPVWLMEGYREPAKVTAVETEKPKRYFASCTICGEAKNDSWPKHGICSLCHGKEGAA